MAHFTGTEAPLGAATTFTGDTMMRNTFDAVKGIIYSDTAGTLTVDQGVRSAAGVITWDFATPVTVLAATGKDFSVDLIAPLWRVRFVQAGTQTVFRLHASATATGFDGG